MRAVTFTSATSTTPRFCRNAAAVVAPPRAVGLAAGDEEEEEAAEGEAAVIMGDSKLSAGASSPSAVKDGRGLRGTRGTKKEEAECVA